MQLTSRVLPAKRGFRWNTVLQIILWNNNFHTGITGALRFHRAYSNIVLPRERLSFQKLYTCANCRFGYSTIFIFTAINNLPITQLIIGQICYRPPFVY